VTREMVIADQCGVCHFGMPKRRLAATRVEWHTVYRILVYGWVTVGSLMAL
jgi:hypothetical protein